VKRLLLFVVAGLALGTLAAGSAEAGDRKYRGGRAPVRQNYGYDYRQNARRDPYFRGRDVVVIREYRPYYRPLPPGLQKRYNRTGYLPPGWAGRVRPLPQFVERNVVRVPRGYRW
jgi:Ni/Co efflux regulator RcnB